MVNYFWSRLRPHIALPTLLGQCILCADHAQPALDLCQACEAELPFLGPHCLQCALPLNTIHEHHCGQCLTSPPPFHRSEAIWLYQPPVAQLLSAFKYQKKLSYGHMLAKIASKQIASAYLPSALPEVLCPIPLHWRRHLQRGFNQSELLASRFSCYLDIPLAHHLCRRQSTPPQQGLNAKQRANNLRNVFSVQGDVRDKTIAVVDDVMTTGATAAEASHCLLAAGAKAVHIWCLARTPHSGS